MAKVFDDIWTVKLRDDQIVTLQIVLGFALRQLSECNKEWLPTQIATPIIEQIIDLFNEIRG